MLLIRRLARNSQERIAATLLALAAAFLSYLFAEVGSAEHLYPAAIRPAMWIPWSFLSWMLNALFLLLCGWMLSVFSLRYSLITTRTALPTLFFLFFFTLTPQHSYAVGLNADLFSLPLLLILLLQLFAGYSAKNQLPYTFLQGVLFSLGFLLLPPLGWLFPLFIILSCYLYRFTFRLIGTYLLGFFTPLFVAGALFSFDTMVGWLLTLYGELTLFSHPPLLAFTPQALSLWLVSLLTVITTLETHGNIFDNKLQTRRFNRAISYSGLYLLPFILLSTGCRYYYLPLLYLTLSLQLGRLYTVRPTRPANLFFLLLILVLILLWIWSFFSIS